MAILRVLSISVTCLVVGTLHSRNASASSGFIGVYADQAGTVACTSIPQGTAATLYIIAKPSGGAAGGISGAEFRIEVTNPSGWFLSPTLQADVAVGSVLDTEPQGGSNAGTTLSWSSCKTGPVVLVGTIAAYNHTGQPTNLIVKQREQPSNPLLTCPLFILCDDPEWSALCMSSAVSDCSIEKPAAAHQASETGVFIATLNTDESGGSGGLSTAYTEIASFPGRLPYDSPWSPTEDRLAFIAPDGTLKVFDAAVPENSPTAVLPTGSEYIAWSPDGQWLACRVVEPQDQRSGLSSLIARDVNAAIPATTILSRAETSRFTWAADGNVYAWSSSGRRATIAPPSTWAPTILTRSLRAFAFPTRASPSGKLVVHGFRAGNPLEESEIPVPIGAHRLLPEDSFPEGDRFLMTLWADDGIYSVVVDRSGDVLSHLGKTDSGLGSFWSTSVSFDGAYAVGVEEVEQSEKLISSRMFVAAVDGSWRHQVLPTLQAERPRCSRVSNLIAFVDAFEGGVRVGSLSVTP